MKKKIAVIILFLISGISLNAQAQKLPPKPKSGNCYVRCLNPNSDIKEWKKVSCRLIKKDSVSIRKIQTQLVELGYEITPSGCIDYETINAFNKLKSEKNILRKLNKKIKKEKK